MPHPNKSNKNAEQNPKQSYAGKDIEDAVAPSNNLWVGNLANDVSDSDLMGVFGKYGALDSITSYSSRSYAFVYFKHIEDARDAKNSLQGTFIRGSPIKIEFARPARQCRSLWVGGIGRIVTKEKLEEEFLKFGRIEEFKFFRDRNTALIDYFSLENAVQAQKSMNGRRIFGDQIRVDFVRSQPVRRGQLPDLPEAKDGRFLNRSMGPPHSVSMPQDGANKFSTASHSGTKRQLSHSLGGGIGDEQPSRVLWVGYPPSVQIDEQMLHNAMILFGEIERIKSFPSRHYSFIEFRSVDEARRAKEGLQGRLFNDPRITIMFSSSELAPGKDYKGLQGEIFNNDVPFGAMHMDMFGHNRPMAPISFPGHLPPLGPPNFLMRPFGPRVRYEGPEFNDVGALSNIEDLRSNNLRSPDWRQPSPAPGVLPTPTAGLRPPMKPVSEAWDIFDASKVHRESKRPRTDSSAFSRDAPSFSLKRADTRGSGFEESYGLGPQLEAVLGPTNSQARARLGSVEAGGPDRVGHPDDDYIWRGIIAKGGTPVCRARCVPIGKGIASELSEVVNCSARTGLDMLAKHYAEAIGFDIIFFLPDSEDDFASYTEFLRYLGSKNRAGVAKLDDGTTLFLVPPSDFLTKVLHVSGPERLYGVVLNLPQVPHNGPVSRAQYIENQFIPPAPVQTDYNLMPQEERNYNMVLHGESNYNPKLTFSPNSGSPAVHSVSQGNSGLAVSQAGVTLTPELIATLTSLMPAKTQSSTWESTPPPFVASSNLKPSFSPSEEGNTLQGWKQDHYVPPVQTGQLSHQFNSQAHVMPNHTTTPNYSTGSSQRQGPGFNLPQISHQFQPQVNHHTTTSYNPSIFQQPNQAHGANTLQPLTERVNSDVPNQVHQVQSAVRGATTSQGSSEGEVDKNQRYQSTLQFAASLLLQIQQQQQQQQAGQGSGNQQ